MESQKHEQVPDSLPKVPLQKPPSTPDDVSARQVYNIVSDLGVGVNIRWRDNLYQAAIIFLCLVIGALVGYVITAQDRALAAIVGGFSGLLIGLFGSGIFLMIFRAIRHLMGKHD